MVIIYLPVRFIPAECGFQKSYLHLSFLNEAVIIPPPYTHTRLIRKTVGTQHVYVLSCKCHFTCKIFFRLCGRLTPPQCSCWMSEFQRILKRPLEMGCKNRRCASICINLTRVPLPSYSVSFTQCKLSVCEEPRPQQGLCKTLCNVRNGFTDSY